MDKPVALLDDWYLIPGTNQMGGYVYDHPDFDDGEKIITSNIVSSAERSVETINTVYKLGKQQQTGA